MFLPQLDNANYRVDWNTPGISFFYNVSFIHIGNCEFERNNLCNYNRYMGNWDREIPSGLAASTRSTYLVASVNRDKSKAVLRSEVFKRAIRNGCFTFNVLPQVGAGTLTIRTLEVK